MENEGYIVQPFVIPAGATNASHIRYRVFFLAYTNSKRGAQGKVQVSEPLQTPHEAMQKRQHFSIKSDGAREVYIKGLSKSDTVRGYNGFPYWMDRITALGNAVDVPTAMAVLQLVQQHSINCYQ